MTVRIAIVQTKPVFGEAAKNVAEAIALMEGTQADLFVLPELFNTGYNFTDAAEVARLAEEPGGPTFQAVSEFARKRGSFVVYGFAEKGIRPYNSASLVGPGGLIGLYRKVHLYYRETLFFQPGDAGFPVFDLPFGKVGLMICFDWIYPESARTLALKGARLIAHPSNLVMPYCPDAMVTRCLENRVFAATANRVGSERRGGIEFSYIGRSEIVSPRGEILVRLGDREAGVAVVEADLETAADKTINEYNDLLKGRRTDQYRLS